ncbi:hypothetical protein DRO03_12195 [Methanosarcinales archaeon]|nr:MAG: hypothetical protein DRO03_12195 [Methanosarcinales archaeon]
MVRRYIRLAFVNLLLVVACWAIVFYYYPMLPEKIPTHFSFHGLPDEWGNKSTIFEVPLIQTGVFLFLFTASLLVKRYPQICNFSVDPELLPPEGKEELYSLTCDLLFTLSIGINLFFAYIACTTINVALGIWGGVNGYITGLLIGIPLFVITLLAIIVYYIIKADQI